MTDNSLKKSSLFVFKYGEDLIMGSIKDPSVFNEETERFKEPVFKFDYPMRLSSNALDDRPGFIGKYPCYGVEDFVNLRTDFISVLTRPDDDLIKVYVDLTGVKVNTKQI